MVCRPVSIVSLVVLIGLWTSASASATESPALPATLPKPGPVPEIRPPEPVVRTLAGRELPIWHLKRGRVPLVSVELLVRAGSVYDPAGKEGLASLTAEMLDEGAGKRNSVELAKELDRLGASLSVSASLEGCTVSLSVLERQLEPALDLFADVLLRPTFDEKDWDRIKSLRLNNLLQARDRATHVAREVSLRLLYGEQHPYGRSVAGYVETVKPVSLDDVRRFYKEHWTSAGAVVVSCGNLSVARVASLLEPRLGDWAERSTGGSTYTPPKFEDQTRPRIAIVNKKDAAQTVIRIASAGIARKDPDYMPLSLANIAFGASFTSRLIRNLREAYAFTYSARSSFDRLAGEGLFVSTASVEARYTVASLIEFEREYLAVRTSGITDDELKKSRATLRNAVIRGLGTINSTASMFLNLARNNLSPDELARFVEAANSTQMDQVKASIDRVIRWDTSTIVMVGDLELIRRQLSESKFWSGGKMVVVDERGKLLSEIKND
jgi:predicted Zn-dependent peptidase